MGPLTAHAVGRNNLRAMSYDRLAVLPTQARQPINQSKAARPSFGNKPINSDSKKPRSFVTPFFAAGYGRC